MEKANDILMLIDELVALVREKSNEKSSFDIAHILKFEFKLLITLDIVRFELQTNGMISNNSAMAVSRLFAFNAFEYYYRDFPDLYRNCSRLFARLNDFNEKLKLDSLDKVIGNKDSDWIKFFNENITALIVGNRPNN